MKNKHYTFFTSLIKKNFTTSLNIKTNDKKGFDYRTFLYKDKDYIHIASFWHDLEY